MRLLKILIIGLLLFLPFGEILRFNLGNNVYLKPLDAIGVLLLLWTIVCYIKEKKFKNSLQWYFFFFPIVGLLSLGINSSWLRVNEVIAAFLYLLRWVSYLSIYFAIIQFDKNFKKKLEYILLADGILVLVIGYLQFFFYPALKNLFYLGWDEHLYRMFSSFFDPNFVGAFFVLYFIFVAGLLFRINKENARKIQIIYSFLLAIITIAIFLTYSRSALLMLVASAITFFLLKQRKKLILMLLGAIVIFVIIISPYFYIENLDLFRVNSSISRIHSLQSVVKIIQDHPLIGVGFDAYRYAQIKYGFIKPTSPFPSHSGSGVDTSLLFVVATTGFAGLAAYCYLWFKLINDAKVNISKKKNIYAPIFIASTVGLFINALFINSLFYAEIMVWMWFIAGLMKE